jgi:xanthine dehydrogenase YagS FAD-binding subunit
VLEDKAKDKTMRPFIFDSAATPREAIETAQAWNGGGSGTTHFLAGGTTLIDLMKLDVMRPERLIDINPLNSSEFGRIAVGEGGLWMGALVRMADAAEHPEIVQNFPAIAQSLQLAASQQIRNMATLGGNVLQRTRCPYFRDVSYGECNKRNPGSGCAALDGFNRSHAVLGTSDQCIASYPGDFAQALIALDAMVDMAGPRGIRRMPFAELHRQPQNRPDMETVIQPGELIVSFFVPVTRWARRSTFLKVRDRESYEFALASAVVGLDLNDGVVRDVRIALGGVATVPWRAAEAEAILRGRVLDEAAQDAAAQAAFSSAQAREHNGFKIELGKRTLKRAIAQAAVMEI